MNKFKIVLIIGLAVFAAGIAVIAAGFSAGDGEENSLAFEKTVTASIANTRVGESTVGRKKKKNGTGHTVGHTMYTYYVEFLVTDGGSTYTEEQAVPQSLYNEYCAIEKNKDMEFNMYVNSDGAHFLSLKDLAGATEEYRTEHVTKAIAVQMISGLIAAAVGWVLITVGANGRKKHG